MAYCHKVRNSNSSFDPAGLTATLVPKQIRQSAGLDWIRQSLPFVIKFGAVRPCGEDLGNSPLKRAVKFAISHHISDERFARLC